MNTNTNIRNKSVWKPRSYEGPWNKTLKFRLFYIQGDSKWQSNWNARRDIISFVWSGDSLSLAAASNNLTSNNFAYVTRFYLWGFSAKKLLLLLFKGGIVVLDCQNQFLCRKSRKLHEMWHLRLTSQKIVVVTVVWHQEQIKKVILVILQYRFLSTVFN